MKKTILLIGLFLLSGLFTSAQYEADSLLSLANKENNPQKKAELLLQAASEITKYDTTKAYAYIALASKNIGKNHTYLKALKHYTNAFISYPFNFQQAQANALEGIELIKNLDDKKAIDLQAQLWYVYAIVEQRKDRAEECLKILTEKCIPYADSTGNRSIQANYYLAAALVLINELNLENSIEYLNKAVNLLEKEPQTQKILNKKIQVNLAFAEAYLRKEDFKQAKSHIEKAGNILTISKEKISWPEYYHINSIYHLLTEDYKTALNQVNIGLDSAKNMQMSYDYIRLTQMKSWILRMLKRPDEAYATLKPLLDLEIAKKVKFNSSTIYQELANIQAEKGNFKSAYEYLWKRIEISDSMYRDKQKETITEMDTKFRTAEKEKEITVKQLEINKKNQYIWLLSISAFVFLGLGVFTFVYLKNKRQLAEQREINLQQKIKQKEQEEELKRTQALMDGEEQERQRLAKDLHDGLGGMLTGIKLKLASWSTQHLTPLQNETFEPILEQLNSTTTELRRVSRNLMPESLIRNGLKYALEDLCEFYSNEHTIISFLPINMEKTFPLNMEVNIYRIVQELLSNAVKHAEATSVLVQCAASENLYLITVEDNGKGMNLEYALKEKSVGLKSLRNRVELLKGKMQITSAPNQGTAIEIELPV